MTTWKHNCESWICGPRGSWNCQRAKRDSNPKKICRHPTKNNSTSCGHGLCMWQLCGIPSPPETTGNSHGFISVGTMALIPGKSPFLVVRSKPSPRWPCSGRGQLTACRTASASANSTDKNTSWDVMGNQTICIRQQRPTQPWNPLTFSIKAWFMIRRNFDPVSNASIYCSNQNRSTITEYCGWYDDGGVFHKGFLNP